MMANPLALKALRLAGKGIKSVVKKLKGKKQKISFKVEPTKRGLDMNHLETKKWLFKTSKHRKKMKKGSFSNKKDELAYRADVNNSLWKIGSKAGESGSRSVKGIKSDFSIVDNIGASRKAVAGLAPVAGMPDRSNVKNKSSNMKIDLKKIK